MTMSRGSPGVTGDTRMPRNFEKGIIFRLLLAAVLGCAALVLFLLSMPKPERTPEQLREEFSASLQAIDHDVDSVLSQFGIEQAWVRKRQVTVPEQDFVRTERRVAIPPNVVPAILNVAFNSMAHQFGGRAVASENVKENIVTIHIELQKVIVQTIILKTSLNLRKIDQTNTHVNL